MHSPKDGPAGALTLLDERSETQRLRAVGDTPHFGGPSARALLHHAITQATADRPSTPPRSRKRCRPHSLPHSRPHSRAHNLARNLARSLARSAALNLALSRARNLARSAALNLAHSRARSAAHNMPHSRADSSAECSANSPADSLADSPADSLPDSLPDHRGDEGGDFGLGRVTCCRAATWSEKTRIPDDTNMYHRQAAARCHAQPLKTCESGEPGTGPCLQGLSRSLCPEYQTTRPPVFPHFWPGQAVPGMVWPGVAQGVPFWHPCRAQTQPLPHNADS